MKKTARNVYQDDSVALFTRNCELAICGTGTTKDTYNKNVLREVMNYCRMEYMQLGSGSVKTAELLQVPQISLV
jgi:hypothetical protein